MAQQQKTYLLGALGLVVIIGLIWWGSTRPQSGANTIKIGGAFGLTGVCAEFGEGELKAAQLAIDEINNQGGIDGLQLELIVEDTQCENRTTVSAFNKLISVDGVEVIIGPTWGDSFQGGFPLVRQAQVVAITPSTAMEALEFQNEPVDYTFSTWFPQRAEINALQRHAQSVGIERMVIVHDQDPFGAMMGDLFKEEASGNDITIVGEHEVTTGTDDFRTVLTKLKSENPQGVFISFLGPDSKVNFIEQARKAGVTATVFSSADIQNEDLLHGFASVLEGVIYTYPRTAGSYEGFTAAHEAKYGMAPSGPAAANAYDAAKVVIAALKAGARTGEQIQNHLLELQMPGTFIEQISFTDAHQVAGGDFEIKTIKDGEFVSLDE